MRFTMQAACGCHTGKLRKNNEDNFFFDGKYLEQENDGLQHPAVLEMPVKKGLYLAVFDGMGGENYGELASFAAARQMQLIRRGLLDLLRPEGEFLAALTEQLDTAVSEAQRQMCTERMGTTMVSLSFSGRSAYICNVGDSRAYRLRDGVLLQLSKDHVAKRPGRETQKAPLTQYLGYGSEEIRVEPYITQSTLEKGDQYLLCSDGLTDMLTELEITDIMQSHEDPAACVQALVLAALEHGGRDNITVIVCKLT